MLEEIGQIVTGKTPSSNVIGAFSSSGIPFVTPKDMDGRRWIETTERYLSEAGRQSLKNYLVPKDSVAVSCIGSDMGKAILLKKDSVTNQQINTIIVDASKHNPKYIYYVLSLKQEELKSIAGGSATPILNKGHFSKVVIELPDKVDQDNIVQVLDSLDCKIELNNQINQNLESMAQAIFKSWFIDFEPVRAKIAAKKEGKDPELAAMCIISGKSEDEIQQMPEGDFAELQATAALFPEEFVESELGEVPKGWEVSTVGEQVQAVGGGTPSTKNADFWDNGIHYWTTPKDLSNLTDKILLNTERKLTDTGLKKISSGLLPKNTVLMSSRAPVGYLALAKIEVAINQGYIAILPNTKYSAEYLIQWCEANMAEIKGRASGTTFLEISKKNFREINFICSDEKVVTVYTKTAKTLYDEISLKAEENQSLINLRDTLLPKLLSGELEVLT